MEQRKSYVWTSTDTDIGGFKRFLITKIEFPFQIDSQKSQELRKQYEGLISRDAEFITMYCASLFKSLGRELMPNYIARAKPQDKDKQGRTIPASLVLMVGLTKDDYSPNGNLERALKNTDASKALGIFKKPIIPHYSIQQYEKDLNFARREIQSTQTAKRLFTNPNFYKVENHKQQLNSKLFDAAIGPNEVPSLIEKANLAKNIKKN